MTRRLRAADRGLASRFLLLLAALGTVGLLYGVLRRPFDLITGFADEQISSQAAQTGLGYVEASLAAMVLLVLLTSLIGGVAAAVFESAR